MIRKSILIFLILIFCLSLSSFGDPHVFFLGWDLYYYKFKIIGYPVYNALMGRYDFYDIDENYCGSLSYNPVLCEWEYFGL